MASKAERMPSTLAAVVITKNEEGNIAACIEALRWADELIVVDAESVDRTVEIARRYADSVFVRPWPGFGPQKNFAIGHAKSEWILIVDADERVTVPLKEEIVRMISGSTSGGPAGFEVPRRNFFYGRWIRGGGIYPDYQLRLFRRQAGRYDDTLVHERLELIGSVGRLTNPFDHYSITTIRQHLHKIARYTTLAADERLKSRGDISAKQVGFHHVGTFLKSYVMRKGYVDGVHGLIVALFAGMYTFLKYAKAWERLHAKPRSSEN